MRGSAAFRAAVAPGGVLAGPWVRNDLWRKAKAVPSLDLRFADNKSLTDAVTGQSLVTFTRTSSATYVGSDGLIKTAATNEPRFDHNPTTGESLGLLVEEQRTNLLLYNRTLTNAAWVVTNITAAKDQTGADGVSNSASSITASAGNATILQTITSASAARATSAYVKRITGTGTVQMTQDNGTTWTAITVTSSWSRVTIPSATVTNPVVGFRVVTSGDAIAVDYVQLESAAVSTSAIETTTAAATRNADVASITGSSFSSWYRQDEGTMFAEWDSASVVSGKYPSIFAFRQASADNSQNTFEMFATTNGANAAANFLVRIANVNQLNNTATLSSYPRLRAACAAKAGDQAGVANGVTAGTSTGNFNITFDKANIGNNGVNDLLNTTIRRLTFFPQRLSNPTLQAITQ